MLLPVQPRRGEQGGQRGQKREGQGHAAAGSHRRGPGRDDVDGRLWGLGLGARPPVRLLRPRGRRGRHAGWSSGAREARRGLGLRRSKSGSKRSDASSDCSHPWPCVRRSRGRCEAREVQGKTEEQQQGISPAAEGVLCSGEERSARAGAEEGGGRGARWLDRRNWVVAEIRREVVGWIGRGSRWGFGEWVAAARNGWMGQDP